MKKGKKKRRARQFTIVAILLALAATGFGIWGFDASKEAEAEANKAILARDSTRLALVRADSLKDEAKASERKVILARDSFKFEAQKGRLLGSTIGNTFQELIEAGKEEYKKRNFQNAMTYWANARFLQPGSAQAQKWISLCEKTIRAEYLAHAGYWGRAEEIFTQISRDQDVDELNNFALTRLNQLAITKVNWALEEKRLSGSSLTVVSFELPLLSIPNDWEGEANQLRGLSFISLDDKAPCLEKYENLTSLMIRQGYKSSSPNFDVKYLSELVYLDTLILYNTLVNDLGPISNLVGLEFLSLRENRNIKALEPLSGLVNLKTLYYEGVYSDTIDLRALIGLQDLQALSLEKVGGLSYLESLTGLGNLQKLYLFDIGNLISLKGLSKVSWLQGLYLDYNDNLIDLSGLSSLESLQELELSRVNNVVNLEALSGLKELQALHLRYNENLVNLNGVIGLNNLEVLELVGNENLIALEGLSGLDSLQALYVTNNEKLVSIGGVLNLPVLQVLVLSFNRNLFDISGLSAMQKLLVLDLSGNDRLEKIDFIANLSVLQNLDLRECRRLSRASIKSLMSQLPISCTIQSDYSREIGSSGTKIIHY